MQARTAFIFPGQGSQKIGMLAELASQFPIILETFQQASDQLGFNAWLIAQQGPEETLNQTSYTQPIMLTADVALYRVWQQLEHPQPEFMAGHSLGEYAALVCANAIEFDKAVKLVTTRGLVMQAAVPEGVGAMAAIIGLTTEQVDVACRDAAEQQVVAAANYNAPGQIVIAGHSEAVARAMQIAKELGAKKVQQLAVSVPAHCDLMQTAAQKFALALEDITMTTPDIPVLHNVDVAMHTTPDAIKTALVQQLYSPVRWIESIEYLVAQGISNCVECGPGKVLTGLNKRISKALTTTPLPMLLT